MDKRKLIYILSPSYSGSTLLTMLLAMHPRIVTIGELKATSRGEIANYTCSCGEPMLSCNYWSVVESEVKNIGLDFSLEEFGTHFTSNNKIRKKILGAQIRGKLFEYIRYITIHHVPSMEKEINRILEQNRTLIEILCRNQPGDTFLDGSKDPHRLLYLQQSGLWDIKVIRMFRDGRAQSNSARQKKHNQLNYEQAVREWKYTIRQIENVSKYIDKESIHTLTYEELCSDPKTIIDNICEYLEIRKLEKDWREIDLKETEHHILGNDMRTKSNIKIALDTKWKDRLDDVELKIFDKIAGDINRSLGYAD